MPKFSALVILPMVAALLIILGMQISISIYHREHAQKRVEYVRSRIVWEAVAEDHTSCPLPEGAVPDARAESYMQCPVGWK